MENNILDIIKETMDSKSKNLNHIDSLIKASEDYEKLIKDGLAKKRGFNLMTTDEIYNPALNCFYSQSK